MEAQRKFEPKVDEPRVFRQSPENLEWKYLTWELAEDLSEACHSQPPVKDGPACKEYNQISNPASWSRGYKTWLAILGCIADFSTTWAGGSYTSATAAMANVWHVSTVTILVGVTVYTIAFGIAPMILAPLSEIGGRRLVILVSGVAFVVGLLFCTITHLYAGMLLSRLLVGVTSSTLAIIAVGVVADIYEHPEDRYWALLLFTTGAMFGCGFGPLISGFIAQNNNWRWVFGVLCVFSAVMVFVIVATLKETRVTVSLSRKAQAWNKALDNQARKVQTGTPGAGPDMDSNVRFKVKDDEERQNIGRMVAASLQRPLLLLVTEPVVFWFSCWASFAWSIMYGMLVVVPYTFETVYSFDLQTSSAILAAICIASLFMAVVSKYHGKLAVYLVSKDRLESPEGILYPVALESTLLPIGLFWYGWSAKAQTHWVVPTLGLACATMGMFSVYLAVFAYLATAYRLTASSASAAQSMTRNLVAGAFPLFSRQMFERLGFGGACSLLGGIGILLSFVPCVLIWFGPRIRARSKLAFSDG